MIKVLNLLVLLVLLASCVPDKTNDESKEILLEPINTVTNESSKLELEVPDDITVVTVKTNNITHITDKDLSELSILLHKGVEIPFEALAAVNQSATIVLKYTDSEHTLAMYQTKENSELVLLKDTVDNKVYKFEDEDAVALLLYLFGNDNLK